MLRFVAGLIALRKRHRSLRRRHFLSENDVDWFGTLGEPPSFGDANARELALTLYGRDDNEPPLHLMLNAGDKARTFVIPRLAGWSWAIAVDTGALAPRDLIAPEEQRSIGARRWRVGARGILVLEGSARQSS
jgi:glycogen operon protein